MSAALAVIWRGVKQFEHHGWIYVISNLFAAILALPIITLPLVFAGLAHLSYAAQTSPTAHIDEFWVGLRRFWWQALIVGAANVIFGIVLVGNFVLYADQPGLLPDLLLTVLRCVWVVAFLIWVCVQLYLWPLLNAMERPSLRDGLRNAAVMLVRHPGFSLTLTLVSVLLSGISLALFVIWVLVTPGLIACISTAAVLDRLALDKPDRAR
jgi:hypothetical protein